ncbi:MAG: hypothetical protein JXA78_10960 [Anaerolineales bacterium]|nr:hypothetical protein [Anaerolineales bacterium]
MTRGQITCPMCGCQYDPQAQVACKACPLHKNCQLARCPVCGYETVDAGRSLLARLVARWLSLDAPGVEAQRPNADTSEQGVQVNEVFRR